MALEVPPVPTPAMAAAWRAAADVLGIRFVSPHIVLHEGAAHVCTGWLPDFGGRLGTIISGRFDEDAAFDAAREFGYYTSGLSPDCYETFERELFVETLDDWGWFGLGDPPGWFSGHIQRHGGTE